MTATTIITMTTAKKKKTIERMLKIRAVLLFDRTPPFTQNPASQTGAQKNPAMKLKRKARLQERPHHY
jgi:hypothetical protein